MRKLVWAAAAAVAVSLAAPAFSQDTSTVLARVDGQEITRADIDSALRRLPPNVRQAPLDAIFAPLLDQLISTRLLANAGRGQDLQSSAEVRRQVRAFEDVAVHQAYLDAFLSAAVSEAEVRARYDQTIGAQESELEVQASHILVSTEEAAREIIAELDGGADFATLAQERSEGPSASRGGDLGYFQQAQMVPPFAEAAFAMEPGDITADPVQTRFGWHVIMVVDRREPTPPSFEESRADIEQELQQAAVGAHLVELSDRAEIERFNLDGTPLDDN